MTGPQFREPREPERRRPVRQGGDPADADGGALFLVFGLSAALCVTTAVVLWTGVMRGWW